MITSTEIKIITITIFVTFVIIIITIYYSCNIYCWLWLFKMSEYLAQNWGLVYSLTPRNFYFVDFYDAVACWAVEAKLLI